MLTRSELLAKYNVPGPRYTSYPTVPYWEDTPSQWDWLEALKQTLNENQEHGISIYIHIPFCESLCTYCGCNTRITKNHALGTKYITTLLKELDLYLEKLSLQDKPLVAELHFGGGTPTFLRAHELEILLRGLHERLAFRKDAEISIEAHPAVTSTEQLDVLARYGVNRLSLGIQDYDPKVQDIVNRHQTPEMVAKITHYARKLGMRSINYDLIYGLPLQTPDSIRYTMRFVLQDRPDRIAFYSYAHVPWIKPSQRRFTEKDLPQGAEKRRLYELGRDLLEESGYREIGMDHFALESDDLWQASIRKTLHRNFMGYTPRYVAPLLGLGVSAIGDALTVFAQNEKVLEKYEEKVERRELPLLRGHILNQEDQILRRHILNLMTRLKTSWEDPCLYTEFLDTVRERLKEMEKDQLVEIHDKEVVVTPEGRAFLRNICMAFDARLIRKSPGMRVFSQTI
ncbi:MAG: oxygen-independent coproporphyrinogen III oxidase [Leptospiraceae bacterium]|nr:oxygen-independent coproporphyrinogen III oxidase [Leptospiraceae bacterium]MDW8305727.1 oxygen-independent coproporphyrinogen III oxidase [Leptospiraceae bacterium]